MTLTIYSDDFEIDDVVNNGMNGKIFLDDENNGKEFSIISNVIMYVVENNIKIEKICYWYSENGVQYYKERNLLK